MHIFHIRSTFASRDIISVEQNRRIQRLQINTSSDYLTCQRSEDLEGARKNKSVIS